MWEDTVMNQDQIDGIPASVDDIEPVNYRITTEMIVTNSHKLVATAQAQISYKAGMQFVVDWLEEHNLIAEDNPIYNPLIDSVEWQAYLMENGL